MAVWALNVKFTGPLVVTAGSALEKLPLSTDFWDPFSDVVLGTLQIAPSDLGAQ